ncbi:hypothetical protein AB3X55_10870 [Alphaproteobacteria bacterium LSUCC0719]
MHPAATCLWMTAMLVLCGCANDTAIHDAMRDEVPVCIFTDPWTAPPCGVDGDSAAQMQLLMDSIRWHREAIDREALWPFMGP